MSAGGTQRTGIMGGSFDPIHMAHLLMAETVREALSLDLVLFMPAGTQPLKQDRAATPAEQRAAMVELAIRGNPAFALSRIDIDRPGPSYTADSLEELRREWGSRQEMATWFILGSDLLVTFPDWREPEQIIAQTRMAVVRRPTFAAGLAESGSESARHYGGHRLGGRPTPANLGHRYTQAGSRGIVHQISRARGGARVHRVARAIFANEYLILQLFPAFCVHKHEKSNPFLNIYYLEEWQHGSLHN